MKFQNLNHVKKFIEDHDTNLYTFVATNIRTSEMDADKEIQNRFAYTSVYIGWEEANSLADVSGIFHHNDKMIKWLYEKAKEETLIAEAEEVFTYIQQQTWISIEPELKAKLISTASSFLQKWSIQASIQYMSPDYIWKSGNNYGKTTMEILTEKWNIRIANE
jgi:hypothetical protein